MKAWLATREGDRSHAVIDSRSLCGITRPVWQAAPWLEPCALCRAMYGVAFPAPPGEPHSHAGVPWFADYAEARAA